MSNHTTVADFNFDWRFILDDQEAFSHANYDDGAWRTLQLPHDWSVEHAFDESLEGATGYLPGGIGWYRKTFTVEEIGSLTSILFDGVYNNASFWINGVSLGDHPYGYTPALFEISHAINTNGQPNVIAVRVNHSHYGDSRWYTGSGIYRNVELITKPQVNIPVWGVFITTPEVSSEEAKVALKINVSNHSTETFSGQLKTNILDPNGVVVASVESEIESHPGSETAHDQEINIKTPTLWHVEQGHLYRAVTSLNQDGAILESVENKFGIRDFKFDAQKGFFLNGESMNIKGVCLHHDAGLVGAAVPQGVWRRRLEKLQEMGCNAIRCAHNPPSAEFLDLCDEMGFLVQNEFFDEWDNPKDKRHNMQLQIEDDITKGYTHHFQEWAEHDLKITMLRDRNHPCIFQWSIGNEIEWTYQNYPDASGYFKDHGNWDYFFVPPLHSPEEVKASYDALPKAQFTLEDTAVKLADWTRELDTTRPVTSNCILPIVGYVTGYAHALDIVGYSYRKPIYDRGHEEYPERPIMGTENVGQWQEWKEVLDRPYLSGIFVWTGITYLGEAHGQWPKKGNGSGFLNFAGFENAGYHVFRSLWAADEPFVHIATQTLEKSIYKLNNTGQVIEKEEGAWEKRLWDWHDINYHWNYNEDELCVLEIASNCEQVELFANGQSLGVQYLKDQADRFFKWSLPFTAGELEARGTHANGRETTYGLKTAKAPHRIELTMDRDRLRANGYDVAHAVAQVVDEDGTPVRHLEQELVFDITGSHRLLGVDNGHINNVQDFQSNRLVTDQGRALLILQSEKDQAGSIAVEVVSDGVTTAQKTILVI